MGQLLIVNTNHKFLIPYGFKLVEVGFYEIKFTSSIDHCCDGRRDAGNGMQQI